MRYERTFFEPLLKRVPTQVDRSEYIQRYDVDNLYPQRCKEVIARSYTLTGCLKVLADFINGEGFADPALKTLIVNDKGQLGMTLDDVLKSVSKPYSEFSGVALHINYNLNLQMSSIVPIKWDYCRLGLPDKYGRVSDIKYCTNWERDTRKELSTAREIYEYPVFNPDPEVVAAQIEECGGIENYSGQILYWTPEEWEYPLATFDPVFEHAQAQAESGEFKIAALQNGFMATTAIVYPGEFTDDKEKREFMATIKDKKGPKGANGIIAIQDPSGTKRAADIFQSLAPPNVDRQWEYTESSSLNAIMENYAMPKELLGVRPESGMFNKENMENAYLYFNTITRNKRNELSRLFKNLMQYWSTPIVSDFKIKEQKFGEEVIETAAAPVDDKVSAVLRSLSRSELAKFYGYVNDFKKGRASLEQTMVFMRAYGLSEQEIMLFLNDDPNDDPKI